jgi:hypothetical protein
VYQLKSNLATFWTSQWCILTKCDDEDVKKSGPLKLHGGLWSRGRDKPAPSHPGDEENLKMPTKSRRSRLFAGPQAGIGQEYPALTLTPSQSSRLEIELYYLGVTYP